jgi:hypothetical protein
MSFETYENRKRIQERRKHQAMISGNWGVCTDAIRKIQDLDSEFAREISPEPPGHPDNPIFV